MTDEPTGAVRGPGRRPGSPDTRAGILSAARSLFAERGLKGTTIRAVAAAAGVDPALVHHYFGAKDDLFLAAMQIKVDPRAAMAPVVAGGADAAGENLMRVAVQVWDDPEIRLSLLGIARGVFDSDTQSLVRDGFLGLVLGPVGKGLDLDRADVRMPLVASQVFGFIIMRYVLRVEPLASMPAEQVVATYAPTLQRYFTGDLP
ncbi:TetR/AcrR family transcriptional regulator [Nocardioides jensenii]|uniref:TetR/AcrR family transcriptional regulator n=1 Tax=Nocardioides jensenii TaxID=1843 RepID=UPI000833B53A|nr:TetR family transcriptional regulator [Nocardioides jensenii]